MHRIILTCALAVVLASTAFAGPTVRFTVVDHGTFDVQLHDNTPLHRDNFLAYMTAGLFDGTIVHRSDHSNAVIQGGAYRESPDPEYLLEMVPTFDPVPYEGDHADSNVMMTVGAARTSDPNSATSQWYVNMADNSDGFDDQPGVPGYTVFGHVVAGWNTVLEIYGLTVWNAGGAFSTLPLEDSFDGEGELEFGDFVTVASATLEPATLLWRGNLSGAWDVSATANWSGGDAPTTYWQGDHVVFDDSGSGTPLVDLAATVRPGSVLVDNDAVDFTFTGTGSLAGPCGLTKRGSGTLTLATTNAYTGETLIEGGTLIVAADGALGASAVMLGDATGPSDASLLVSGAFTVDRPVTVQDDGSETSTRVLGGTHTAGTATFSGGLTLSGSLTVTAASGSTVRLAGPLDNSGGHTITKTGQGTVVFDGAQTHGSAARLDVGAGTVDLNTDAGSAAAATLSVAVTGGAVNFGCDQHLASLQVTSGTARLAAGGSTVLVADALLLAPAASLDLADGSLVVDYEPGLSPVGAVAGWVQSGFRDGPTGYWDGPGIASSAAAAYPDQLTAVGVLDNTDEKVGGKAAFAGEDVDPTSILVRYTWWGDANLDGVVDANDYDVIDKYFLFTPDPDNMGWWTGDFTYDGVIDANDYDRIDRAFLFQTGPLGGGADGGPAAPTPEPATVALLAVGGLALLRRPRKA